jgi:ribosomal RNA-processing protein 17
LREERKQELEAHVAAVNAALENAAAGFLPDDSPDEGEEWGGIVDYQVPEPIDHEEEYIDEEKYTTVTVEAVDVTKSGVKRLVDEEEDEETRTNRTKMEASKKLIEDLRAKKAWPKKERKQKFRYESKAERKFTRGKQKAGNKSKADARRGQ